MAQTPRTQVSPTEEPELADMPSFGYPKLAGLMAASAPAAIFRKFGELQMINLLRLQARLQDLEQEYRDIRAEDVAYGETGRGSLVKDFRQMQEMAESEDGESEQYDVLNKIQVALKEYNEALLQVVRLDQAEGPLSREIQDLRKWLIRPSMGNNFLVGAEALTWDKVNDDDFISPRVGTPDKFNSLLTGSILDAYHWAYGHRKENRNSRLQDSGNNLRIYDDKKITKVADALAAVTSSLLPTVMILVLYFVHNMLWRLGLLIIFTAVFSASITVFTNAKKIEVYSATAAFAAVEVVFIGSTANAG